MSDIFDPSFLRKDKDLQGLFLTLLKGGLHKQARDSVGMLAAHYVRQRTKDALASAKVLMDTDLSAEEIAKKAIKIASEICVFTNDNLSIEKI